MNDRIVQTLAKLFVKNRIVFWCDAKHELYHEFEALSLPGVKKLELNNNEYGIKYRLLREEPEQKFLLYRKGPQPDDLENWLLDMQLAHKEFQTDQEAIWLSELGLGLELADIVKSHEGFYRVAKRRKALKKILKPDDNGTLLRLKMLAVCAGSEPRMDAVMESLLRELADGQDEKIRLISRFNLDGFLWKQLDEYFAYESDEPGIEDFAIELFKSCYAIGMGDKARLNGEALVFFRRWKDSRQHVGAFEKLSDEYAKALNIELDLSRRDFRGLIELDYFQLIDRKIVGDLVHAVVSRTVSSDDVEMWLRKRREGHWYSEYRHLYQAIDCAARFIHSLENADFSMDNMVDAVKRYSGSWYKLDQLYRKYTYNVAMSGEASLMDKLTDRIENLYSNSYLLRINDRFQSFVDGVREWKVQSIPLQKDFFRDWVRPFLLRKNKVCVIISDAMRYEVGEELLRLIRKEDRYDAKIEPALCMLPSYTQMGMAALLPNSELELVENKTGTVKVDGQVSQGTANRTKILDRKLPGRAMALKADDLMAMKNDDCRVCVRDHDVIYVYHNRIDAIGDKMESEEQVFEAVEDAFRDLIQLIKKLTGANANNLFVTSDHGFIYQNRAIDESDFSGTEAKGKEIFLRDRRFVFGRGLTEARGLRKFTSAQLGLVGEVEVQIPKSINRLRLKGSGSRFVHGGASLQEVVIPVLKINKKRRSDVTSVEVNILSGANSVITSGQLGVTLYQAAAVTDKVQPRTLRVGIYTETGELISDSHEITFDLTSNNPRDREHQVRFVLTSKSDEANYQEVVLKLEEKHGGTSHYKEYKSHRYLMRRSFTSDFDF
ncbi:MAG: BREX-1 system phosphatase PglZ type A [Candidatus Dadabacteria bacterium]|nr:BREX-1 system phosphatase PglZ type A [Candidatus Dadabacteria bacterium]